MLKKILPSEKRVCEAFLRTRDIASTAAELGITQNTAAKYIYCTLVQNGDIPLTAMVPQETISTIEESLRNDTERLGLAGLKRSFPDTPDWILRYTYYEYVHTLRNRCGERAVELIRGGLTMDEAAGKMGVTKGTVCKWLVRPIFTGAINATDVAPEEDVLRVLSSLNTRGRRPYTEIFNELGGEVPYETIRLSDTQWCRQNAVKIDKTN